MISIYVLIWFKLQFVGSTISDEYFHPLPLVVCCEHSSKNLELNGVQYKHDLPRYMVNSSW